MKLSLSLSLSLSRYSDLMHQSKNRAFTLIELSVVLVVIGLIIGGVLVGQDLLRVAQARKLMSGMQSYETAFTTFKIKYNCIPGDCNQALTFGLGPSGNGDRLIGSATSSYTSMGGCLYYTPAICNTVQNNGGNQIYPIWGEIQWFWLHLANSGLVKDQNISELSSSATGIDLDDYFPRDALGKSNMMAYTRNRKLYIRTGFDHNNATVNAASVAQFFDSVLDSVQMRFIHTKMGYNEVLFDQDDAYKHRVIPIDLCTAPWCSNGFKNNVYVPAGHWHWSWQPAYQERCAKIDGSGKYYYNLEKPGYCNIIWQVQ